MASFFGPTMIPNTDNAVKTNLDRRTRKRTPSVMDLSPWSPSLNYWHRSRGSKNPQKSFECPSKGLEDSWWNYKKILTCTNSLCAVFQCIFAYNLLNLCPYFSKYEEMMAGSRLLEAFRQTGKRINQSHKIPLTLIFSKIKASYYSLYIKVF